MRLRLIAVGRLRRGPDADLCDDYIKRFNRMGRALSLGPLDVVEVEDKRNAGMAGEASLIRKAIPAGAKTMIMDERGTQMTSPQFADHIARWRDDGLAEMCLIIDGADGIDASLRSEADAALAFGKMVWPHMLARVMLCEQLYRAANILSGTPYHRV